MRDFHYWSLHNELFPVALRAPRYERLADGSPLELYGTIIVRIHPNSLPDALEEIEAVWNAFAPDYPFSYTFLDECFEYQYRNESRLSLLLNSFAAMSLFVSALGMFSLVTFSTQQRTKEIGVRKVLGETMLGILLLLSRDFGRRFLIGDPARDFGRLWELGEGFVDDVLAHYHYHHGSENLKQRSHWFGLGNALGMMDWGTKSHHQEAWERGYHFFPEGVSSPD